MPPSNTGKRRTRITKNLINAPPFNRTNKVFTYLFTHVLIYLLTYVLTYLFTYLLFIYLVVYLLAYFFT